MKKNGFTLIELLGVIVILAVLMIFAVPNVMKMISSSRNELTEQTVKELGDAALSYVSAEIFLKDCANGTTPSNINGSNLKAGCYKVVTVSQLIEKGYFEDSKKACDKNAKIVVYHYVNKSSDTDINEYRYYLNDNICSVD